MEEAGRPLETRKGDAAKRNPKDFLTAGLSELEAEEQRRSDYKVNRYFLDVGPYSREHYPKQIAFFEAGASYRERCLIAANRVGKTDAGAFETTLHLTGLYPTWWTGRRYKTPVSWWVAGDTSKTVRDIVQQKLLGSPGAFGTGFLPRHLIQKTATKQGVADAIETVWVRHASGGTSTLTFKPGFPFRLPSPMPSSPIG